MEKFSEVLMRIGNWATQNKYLGAIANAFQTFMPFIIIGAIGVLWSNVIVNDQTGLGALWKPIMALKVLNPAFDALNFTTIGCITVGVTALIGMEMGKRNGIDQMFSAFFPLACLFTLVPTAQTIYDKAGKASTLQGIFSDTLGTNSMFTGMVVAIIAIELFTALYKVDGLKLKMPEQVPEGVARSFEYLIPGFLCMLIISLIGLGVHNLTGLYVSELIYTAVQTPLQSVGGSIGGLIILELVALLFWCVGLHGDNMISGVFTPLMTALSIENMNAVAAGKAATHIVNWSFARIVYATGGTGMCIGLTLAILIAGKREENRTIAKLAIVPNLFNIMEIDMFGLPMVLNPILLVPFVISPIVTTLVAYFLSVVGIMPVIYLNLPWTMPPFLYAFIGSGGSVVAGLIQLGLVAISTMIYMPFVKIYEKHQAEEAALAE